MSQSLALSSFRSLAQGQFSLYLYPRTSDDAKNHVLVKRDHGAGGGGEHHHHHDHGDHQSDHGSHQTDHGSHSSNDLGSHQHTSHGSSSHQQSDQQGFYSNNIDSSQDSHYSSSSSSYGEDDRLDQQIRFLINDLQNKIEMAKTTIEDSIAFTNLKKTTQGWAIIVGSWKDILSDWVGQDFSQDQAATFGE